MSYADSPVARTHRASRMGAMELLERFLPRVEDYGAKRNFDLGPNDRSNVSRLSPYLTTRLLSEPDVIKAVLDGHAFESVEAFVEEVCWRTYWKGWLEMRPTVWADWQSDCENLEKEGESARCVDAMAGRTGIECFDAWSHELTSSGYLHNHARMWFASIWIFTLELPWQLGARFFYEHLLDADAASNTLSWRWVAGIQTVGKNYVATSENIEKFTAGRWSGIPRLAESPVPITDARVYPAQNLDLPPEDFPIRGRIGALLHGEDGTFEIMLNPMIQPVAVASGWPYGFNQISGWSRAVCEFRKDALHNSSERAMRRWSCPATDLSAAVWTDAVNQWAKAERLDAVVTPYLPVGPWRDFLRPRLAEVACPVHEVVRPWDRQLWPHASRGYFHFRKRLPDLLKSALG